MICSPQPQLSCVDCKTSLEWKGRGRKPKRCKKCSDLSRKADRIRSNRRGRLHKAGRPASKWGDLWLVDGKVVRREARYVWGATGDNDSTVMNRSGVFHYAGKDGLPDGGFTVSNKALQAVLLAMDKAAKKQPESKKWLARNPYWWKFEEHAHETLARDITDSVVVHASTGVDCPDEHTPGERCSWCGECRPLILAGEFCGEDCFTDYVKTYSAYGLDLEGGSHVDDDARGVAEGRGREDDALVR